jgi:hypothetical protein
MEFNIANMKLSEVLNWCMMNPGRAIYRERFDYYLSMRVEASGV